MLIGQILGSATSTVKHASMQGQRLVVVQPIGADGVSPDGDPVLAIDQLGASAGQHVVLTSDGRGAREMLGVEATPVRWTTLGVVDD
ncbi:MAG: EutN/CcmL family microcompartment protein [Planctomycetales bacterium]|nr:EutN/CcmL family microcompartment protein [Planctomycetales bacterium]